MSQYIDKDAVVAEIQRRAIEAGFHDGVIGEIREDECYSILSLIDTLEVKEVKEEPVNDDLEDAARVYCVDARKGYPRVMDETDRYICNAFKVGANWQKEQMMNNAEPAEVGFWNQRGLSILFDKSLERLGLKEDEKVKVLIIKE